MARMVSRATLDPAAPRLLVFDHVFKCGGSSIRAILATKLGLKWCGLDSPADLRGLPGSPEPCRVVMGHQAFGCHVLWPTDWQALYFTFLRDPLAVALSGYRYRRNKTGLAMGLSEYLTQVHTPNMLVEHLGGGDPDRARLRVFEEYAGFGVVEHFGRSLAHLAPLLGLADTSVEKWNASPPGRLDLCEAVRERFLALNAEDVAFHAEAVQRLLALTPGHREDPGAEEPTTVVHTRVLNPALRRRAVGQDGPAVFRELAAAALAHPHYDDAALAVDAGLALDLPGEVLDLLDALRTRFPGQFDAARLACLDRLGRTREAEALLDQEARFLDGLPLARPDSWIARYRADLALTRTMRRLHQDPEAAFRLRLEAWAARFADQERELLRLAETLAASGLHGLLLDLAGPRLDRPLSNQARLALHAALADAAFALGHRDRAREHCRAVLALNPLHFPALRTALVLDRLEGAPLALLDQAREFRRVLAGTALDGLMAREMAASLAEAGREEEAWAELAPGPGPDPWAGEEAQLAGLGLPFLPFADLGDLDQALVLRAGPWLAVRRLYRDLFGPRGRPFDLMGRIPDGPGQGDTALVRRVLPLPPDSLNQATGLDNPGKYRQVLAVLSGPDLAAHARILDLARGLAQGPVLVYVFGQMVSERFAQGCFRLDRDPGA